MLSLEFHFLFPEFLAHSIPYEASLSKCCCESELTGELEGCRRLLSVSSKAASSHQALHSSRPSRDRRRCRAAAKQALLLEKGNDETRLDFGGRLRASWDCDGSFKASSRLWLEVCSAAAAAVVLGRHRLRITENPQ